MRLRITLVGLAFLLASCASGPAPPARGTPGWYWQAAGETYAAGDLGKTSEHLESLAKPGNEFADRAIPWRMVITAGMATGYVKVAEGFELGAKVNRAAATAFRKQMNDYRSQADRQALQFAQILMSFEKAGGEGAIPLAFSFPKGSTLPVAEVSKAAEGIMLSGTEVAAAERRSLEREVQMMACVAVGATEDVAKAQSIFSAENASVPRDVFVRAVAAKLHEMTKLYGRSKLGRPDRAKQLNEIALSAVKSLPESDESKALIEKIEEDL
ncbi:MAG: hypothetical protein GY953_14405 [bacterium]|nr:hypothetical protein [bacterium]